MTKKNILLFAMISLGIIGSVLAAFPFIFSLNPSAKVDASIFIVDASKMKRGTYKIVEHPLLSESHDDFSWSVLLLKMSGGDTGAWILLTKNKSVLMPDMNWWKPIFECRNFGPTIVHGTIDATSVFECHDKNVPEWFSEYWKWDIGGQNLSGKIDNMKPAVWVAEGNFYVAAVQW